MAHYEFLDETGLSTFWSQIKNYLNTSEIAYNTSAYWAEHNNIISVKGCIYVYSDWKKDSQGRDIPGFKVGDGLAYVVDLPFKDQLFIEHMDDTTIHVNSDEKEFWNNKVRCYLNPSDNQNIIFTIH